MTALDQLRPLVGMKRACQALAVPRATWYRRRRRRVSLPTAPRSDRRAARALSESEQSAVLACLHEERFQDCSPAQVYAALLDEGRFHCSIRTMYRLLETHGENRERRDQLIHPPYQKPELLATEANQLGSWDITKLRGPMQWTAYHLYVILDVFSRYVVGWMIAYRESAELAKRLIEHTCLKQNIAPGQLTVHSARNEETFAQQLPPHFAYSIDAEVGIEHALHLDLQHFIPLGARRHPLRIAALRGMFVIRRRGDRQHPADRLDPILFKVIVNKTDHGLGRRSSSAIAKYADALRRISLAWRSSRFSRSSAFIFSATSVGTPARVPRSTSQRFTHP
jgi:hypothetical protein